MRKFLLTILLPSLVFGQTAIYRSVQNKSTAIASPASMSISGTTMTVAALPDTIGVGDAVEYDSSGSSGTHNAICFIYGRTSSTSYTVARFNGGAPASCSGATNGTVFRAYLTSSGWEAGTENSGITAGIRNFDTYTNNKDITSATGANQQWNITLYNGEDTGCQIDWPTATANYISVYAPYLITEVGTSQRNFTGVYSAKYARIKSATFGIQTSSGTYHLRVSGIQFWQNGSGASAGYCLDYGTLVAGYDYQAEGCIFRGSDNSVSAQAAGVQIFTNTSTAGTVKVSNCVFYNFTSTSATVSGGPTMRAAGGTMYVSNCTTFNCKWGYKRTNGTLTTINCIADLHGVSGGSGFNGTITNGDYCVSSVTDAPGAHSKNAQVPAFVDSTNNNFMLKSTDTVAKNAGTDLSAGTPPISTDIQGDTRPKGASFDMGADEEATSSSRGRVIMIGSTVKFALLFLALVLVGIVISAYRLTQEYSKDSNF